MNPENGSFEARFYERINASPEQIVARARTPVVGIDVDGIDLTGARFQLISTRAYGDETDDWA